VVAASNGWLKWAWGLAAAALVAYFLLDPATNAIFPKCPFYVLTGLKCPGCGSQRALHALLHLQVGRAFRENPLLVISLPYLLTALVFFLKKVKNEQWQAADDLLFRGKAVKVVLFVVLAFWLLRNLL
jgi:hypothetical protein